VEAVVETAVAVVVAVYGVVRRDGFEGGMDAGAFLKTSECILITHDKKFF
jgi:hypothetical protein